ncbi:MAG: helicase HerA-like domain-containing protein [Chitinophagales bacterium]|nr:DUF853 family protein [Bacteroidota bacterium]
MSQVELFKQAIDNGYATKGDFIVLGGAMLNEKTVLRDTFVKAPLRTLNRHGLIAGATGTGKTKTIQVLTETLSLKGVPIMLMDIKGDLSGLAAEGECNAKIEERHEKIGIPYEPMPFPVELLSLSEEKGARLRATVSEFGPVLFSKILDLNDTQAGIVALVFKYADDNGLPLLDIKDFRKVVNYLSNEGKAEIEETYGSFSSVSVGAILRKLIELEQQGADVFFGERSFDPQDLLRQQQGKGVVSILRLTDLQDRPKLFSTFMLSLLAEIYSTFPEEGDLDKPKLLIFIDEAHLIFNEASKALLNQIETIVKLIRSKGVGIIFCTQNPTDVPDEVLSQLGLKVQHALRAFTAKDRKMIKLTAENYPISEFYTIDEMLTSLGIGEAAITVLDEKGRPTPLARTLLCAPRSRMDILDEKEINTLVKNSKIATKYNEEIDRESAYEMLGKKFPANEEKTAEKAAPKSVAKGKKDPTIIETVSKNTFVRQMGRTILRELTRGFMGVLTGKRR